MQVETLGDVLDWTRAVHQNLARGLAQCASTSGSERVRMLTDYFVTHERELARVVALSKQDASLKALNTWMYDYFENAPLTLDDLSEKEFDGETTAGLIDEVMTLHEQVIDLYKYLRGRAEVPSTATLVDSLLDLEEHETMLMFHQAQRMEDL